MLHTTAVRVTSSLVLVSALACAARPRAAWSDDQAPRAPVAAPVQAQRSAVEVEVARVVDGDTIHVQLAGKLEKLRLLSVDTEEKIGTGASSATKPATVFGEECALWAQQFFAKLEKEGRPARVKLAFPPGEPERDAFGRMLCHVILPDGKDYNVLLVELGKSPYFTKYGRSTIADAEFRAAQEAARKAQLGIWNPKTNEPATAGAPSAKRPYERLMPWWDARGDAVDAFRAARASAPDTTFDANDATSLARAAKLDQVVRVFGEVEKGEEGAEGALVVKFRTSARDRGVLRVSIPKDARKTFEALELATRGEEFRQNYVWYTGKVRADDRGFTGAATEASHFALAAPDPEMPKDS